MSTIIVYISNLKPDVSKADIAMSIQDGDDLQKKILQLAGEIQTRMECIAPGCYNDLHLLCNCNSEGLQLGSGVNARNISEVFAPLKYKVGNITLHCCDGASNYYCGNNGLVMCSKLSKATYANVRASHSSETTSGRTNVLTWNQRGQIIMLEHYENGELIATYDHPGELLIHEVKRSRKKISQPKKQLSFNLPGGKFFRLFSRKYFQLQQARLFKVALLRVRVSSLLSKNQASNTVDSKKRPI